MVVPQLLVQVLETLDDPWWRVRTWVFILRPVTLAATHLSGAHRSAAGDYRLACHTLVSGQCPRHWLSSMRQSGVQVRVFHLHPWTHCSRSSQRPRPKPSSSGPRQRWLERRCEALCSDGVRHVGGTAPSAVVGQWYDVRMPHTVCAGAQCSELFGVFSRAHAGGQSPSAGGVDVRAWLSRCGRRRAGACLCRYCAGCMVGRRDEACEEGSRETRAWMSRVESRRMYRIQQQTILDRLRVCVVVGV